MKGRHAPAPEQRLLRQSIPISRPDEALRRLAVPPVRAGTDPHHVRVNRAIDGPSTSQAMSKASPPPSLILANQVICKEKIQFERIIGGRGLLVRVYFVRKLSTDRQFDFFWIFSKQAISKYKHYIQSTQDIHQIRD